MTSWLARWQALPGNARGIAYLLLTALLLSLGAYCIRAAGTVLAPYQIILLRNVFALSATLLFCFPRGRPNAFCTSNLRLQLLRGALSFLSMSAYYWSYINLPLAEATALMFTIPLFLIILSVAFMGERVGWRRTLATALGFAGVMMILSPDLGRFEPALLVPLSIGLVDAVITLVIKRLTATETLRSIMVYMSAVSFVFSAAAVALGTLVFSDSAFGRLAGWRDPTADDILLCAALAAFSLAAQLFNVMGWRAGEPTAISSAGYAQIVFVAILGAIVFGEVPASAAVAGTAVIVASTVYIARREARLARARTMR
ncbi:MAG: DMT family transporter [Alphaproteobacteria bacterium]